jgi:opacity protein-like surface antigen
MRRTLFGGLVALVVALAAAPAASAQETFTPVFKAPYRAFSDHEFGATLSFPDYADFGLEGFYTYGKGTNDFGLRGGIVSVEDGFGDSDTRFVIGGNFRTRVISYNESFPLDGALTVGVGGMFGGGDELFVIPVGVSLGRRLQLEGSSTTFTPYVHPVLAPVFGSGDSEVEFALGLGVDVNIARNLSARVSAGVGDALFEGVGFSLAFVR